MLKLLTLVIAAAVVTLPQACLAATTPLTSAYKDAIVTKIADKLASEYIVADKGVAAAHALLAADKNGEFAGQTDGSAFASALTGKLRSILHDLHLLVEYNEEPQREVKDGEAPTMSQYDHFRSMVAKRTNFGIERVEHMEGNIGYLNIGGFPDAPLMADNVAAAMQLVANTDALIIDLRTNRGGDPAGVDLVSSYFFPGWSRVHLNDIVRRTASGFETEQFWSVPVSGPLYLTKPVYVLTSKATISAGEGLAYELQAQKRATVIGEVTIGAANPAGVSWIDPHFDVLMPGGRAVNPITKTNWEGTGVQPDVRTTSEDALAEALKRARATTKPS